MNDITLQESFDKAVNAPSLLEALREKLDNIQNHIFLAKAQTERTECVNCYVAYQELVATSLEVQLAVDILDLIQSEGTFNNE